MTVTTGPAVDAGSSTPTDPDRGLSDEEVAARRAAGLGNDYRAPTSHTYWEIFRDNSYPFVNGPLVLVSGLLVAFGSFTEALLTAGPVLGNILIGVVQGSRAKQQLDRVALLSRAKTRVVRDRREREVDPSEVVVGDIVVARRGDQIQLDGCVVGDGTASLDESALTGESDAIEKRPGDEVQSGSAVVSGTARYQVLAVGAQTFANRILSQAMGRRDVRTPLQMDIARAFVAVGVLIVLSSAIVFLSLNAAGGGDPKDAVTAAAVLVTLVPQGLALMLTVTYAAAAVRISRLGALAQRQSAIEAMSRIDTFCTDKTGTLTTQRISFAAMEPLGDVDAAEVERLLTAYASSTTAPNATTAALAAAFPGEPIGVAEEVPFSSALRWSAVRFEPADAASATGESSPAAGRSYVLGAPAVLLASVRDGAEAIAERASAIASLGNRVLVFGRSATDAPLELDGAPALPGILEPLALLTFTEELRPEARRTIEGLQARGIDVKIVSGDDPNTVEAIARQLGLAMEGGVASGIDLAKLEDEALGDAAAATSVFGRVDPHLKARLVKGLRARGRYVAMTGDGVNDILPVRSANVGVAMQSGSPATRGVADLVLVRDDFSILPEAIRDGQRIVAAMAATLTVLLARTFYVLLIIVGSELLSLPFPFTPRQNSILAFVTVGVPIIVLALWVEPRPTQSGLLGRTLRVSVPLSFAVAVIALPVFGYVIDAGTSPADARTILTTVASFMGIGALTLIPVAPDEEGRVRMPAWTRTLILVATMTCAYLLALFTGIGRDFFELTPLPAGAVAVLGAIAIAWTIAVLLIYRSGIVERAIDGAIALARRARPVGGG